MFGLRLPLCLAMLVAGCGDLSVGVHASALNSCNDDVDCPVPGLSGGCVGARCNNHECEFTTDATLCPTGCTVAATDCQVTGACNTVPCKPADVSHANPFCDFNDYTTMLTTCACTMDGDCTANVCQQSASCQNGTCTFAAKAPIGAPCCNIIADCGGTATCSGNVCSCSSLHKYCSGAAAGDGRCVPSTGCCLDTDCPNGNTCQARTCSVAGACGFVSNGNAGCCDDATADCGGTATCTNNSCTCGTGQKFCVGSGPGNGSCIPTSGCCVDGDCAARANATVSCNSNACVYTCTSGFHDCSGVCKDDTSVASCGNSCSACAAGNACQTAMCNGTNCGFSAAGASPCCNSPSDCVPANACQKADSCDNNECVFASTGDDGCCNKPDDCTPPTDECLQATCVANQCATAPVADCTPDGGTPAGDDLAAPVGDLAGLQLGGGGGCAMAGRASPRAPALVVVALFLFALSLRRRSA
jgi:hypothetical protein